MQPIVAAYPAISTIPGGHATGCEVCGLAVLGDSVGHTATAYGQHVTREHSIAGTASVEAARLLTQATRTPLSYRVIAVLEVIAQEATGPVSDTWGMVGQSSWPAERVADWAGRTAEECQLPLESELHSSLLRLGRAALLTERV
jgi:hypothetical protein